MRDAAVAAAPYGVVACGGLAARHCRMSPAQLPVGGRHEDPTYSSCLALFCIALELQGPVRADVVVTSPVFTDHAR